MPLLHHILGAIQQLAPWELAESWDQVGLQVGRGDQQVHKVMVALDLNPQVINEGISGKVDGFIVHHPLIFKPLSQLNTATPLGRMISDLIKNNFFLVAAHTNVDKASGGLNYDLATRFGLTSIQALEPAKEPVADVSALQNIFQPGLGCLGVLPEESSFDLFCQIVKECLKAEELRISGNPLQIIKRVALCSGSGGSLLNQAIAKNVDLYLTGELNYHDFLTARQSGLAVIVAGHWTTEKGFIPLISNYLKEFFDAETDFEVISSNTIKTEPYLTFR